MMSSSRTVPFGISVLLPAFLLAGILFVSGCGKQDSHQVVRFEEDGLQVVRTEGGSRYESPLFTVEEDLVLGIDEGEPAWQIFNQYFWFAIGPDDRIYVADSPDNVIHLLSPSGELIKTFSRRGQGPGELTHLRLASWIEDELWLDDSNLKRVQRFTRDGEFLDIIWYGDQMEHFGYFEQLSNTSFLGEYSIGPPTHETRFSLVDKNLKWVRDILTMPMQPMMELENGLFYPQPFTYIAGVDPYPDGRMLAFDPQAATLTVYASNGEPLFRIEREWKQIPVTAEDKQRWRANYEDRREAYIQDMLAKAEFPAQLPPFRAAMTYDEGRAWVQRSQALRDEQGQVMGYEFDVFDREGVWLGTQPLALAPTLIQNGFMYVRTRGDEFIGPRLIRYRLIPSFPG